MDQDRWSAASLEAGTEDRKHPPQQPAPFIDRYKYDLEQAKAMRARLKNPSTTINTTGGNNLEDEDVHLGLRGLDEADALQEQGELKEALRLYQLSIDLLLRFLRESSPRKKQTLDVDTVAERVKVALSDAERIKEALAAQTNQLSPQRPSQPSSETSREKKKSRKKKKKTGKSPRSLSSSIESALSRMMMPSAAQPPPAHVASQQHVVQSSHSTSRLSSVSRPSPSSAHPAPAGSITQSVSSKQPATRRRTRLDYDKDPLVQTIKSDLYIDPSELEQTTWDDIAGLAHAKQSLQESAILPLLRPDLFTGLRRPQNILLYGPPGTGKTMLVKAVAHKSSCLLFACTASNLTSKWHGEGEKLVRTLFQVAHDVAPSIIFVDELDALLSARRNESEHEASRRFKTEFMVQMDGIGGSTAGGVLLLGCTNCPWDVDEAVLRRFPRRIHIPLPDADARKALWKMLLKKAGRHTITSHQRRKLVARTEGFSCSDIRSVASEAAFGPIRTLGNVDAIRNVRPEDVRPISMEDAEHALDQATKSVTPALLERYKQWEQQQAAS